MAKVHSVNQKCLDLKLELLEQLRGDMHRIIDDYVNSVMMAAKQSAENKEARPQFYKMLQTIDSAVEFLELECKDISVKVYESDNVESKEAAIRACESDHEKFTLVEDFLLDEHKSLNMLPESIRHESVLEYIRIQEKLVVRIKTNVRGQTGKKDKKRHYGTGRVYISSSTPDEYTTCPLQNCGYYKGQAHKCYGGMVVYTSKHVICDSSEAGSCSVNFFYNKWRLTDDDQMMELSFDSDDLSPVKNDCNIKHEELFVDGQKINCDGSVDCTNRLAPLDRGENSVLHVDKTANNCDEGQINDDSLPEGISAYGYVVREHQHIKNLVELQILYHERELYTTIKKYIDLRSAAWSKIPAEVKIKMKKHVIIISHPHGEPKKISFGNLISLEEDDRKEKHRKMTKYDAATCKGSSGSPVLTGHYPYRPFVHSTKVTKVEYGNKVSYGVSFSY